MKCPKCGNILPALKELADGLPGVFYRQCRDCGYVRLENKRGRRHKLSNAERRQLVASWQIEFEHVQAEPIGGAE